MNWKSTAAVSGVTLLATWLGLTPSRPVAVTSAPAVDPRPAGARDIEHQADRLQMRVRHELEYRDPSRNPFRFAPKPAAVSRAIAQPAAAIPVTVAPVGALLPFSLSGMAADIVDGQLQRTAILTSASDVLFVKEGDRLANGYTVTRVDATGVEFTTGDGGVYRLALTP